MRWSVEVVLVALVATTCAIHLHTRDFYYPRAILYAQDDCKGDKSKEFNMTSVPDLRPHNFDKKAVSAAIVGLWVFHEDYEYGQDKAKFTVFADKPCCVNTKSTEHVLSSVRFVGWETSYRVSSITFFEHSFFAGKTEVHYNAAPALAILDQKVQSFLITGIVGYTLYNQPNFAGDSRCIQPFPQTHFQWVPKMVQNLRQVQLDPTFFRSVKIGCNTHRRILLEQPNFNSRQSLDRANNCSFISQG